MENNNSEKEENDRMIELKTKEHTKANTSLPKLRASV